MNSQPWTFGQKLSAAFAAVVAVTLLLGWLSVSSLKGILADKDRVIEVNAANMIDVPLGEHDPWRRPRAHGVEQPLVRRRLEAHAGVDDHPTRGGGHHVAVGQPG